MIILSPRSYVTGAFDIFFDALLKYVYNTLSKDEKWWPKYVHSNKNDIFSEEDKYRKKCPQTLNPINLDKVSKYFDELSLLRLVTVPKLKPFFTFTVYDKSSGNIISEEQFKTLIKVRTQWAHRGYRNMLDKNRTQRERDWAEESINEIKKGTLLICPEAHNRISLLEAKMKYDWICEDRTLCTKDDLIDFIENNIISAVLKPGINIDGDIKKRIEKSWLNLRSTANTPGDVIAYYWDAIKDKNQISKELRDKGLPTFEDLSAHFADLCFKVRDT